MGSLLTARGLTSRYRGGDIVLADVDLTVAEGELLLLLGRSAGGKTSLLRCLNGLVPRSYRSSERTGSVRICGDELSDLTPAEVGSRVGTLLQDPERQVIGFDVRREIAFGPENLGLPLAEVQRRVREAAGRLELEALLDRPTSDLSGGELQKVALAGVLAMEPRVLLLDEPLAALDPASAHAVSKLLRELADEGRAVVVVEHRVEALLAARPDRVLELDRGRVVYDGDVDAFFARADPRHAHLPADVACARWRELDVREEEAVLLSPDPAAPPAIELDGVCFSYPEGREVLTDLCLSVQRGERVALLGANGSGKSTLLLLAMRLLSADTGTIRIGGRDTAGVEPAELAGEVGLVFQDPGAMLFADTVEEECSFGPRALGLADETVRRNVDNALERFGLGELRNSSPGALSIGQKKRLTLAAVAASGVSTWLVDEPTAGLDPSGVRDFLLALLATGDSTVLFATHDLDLALIHAHRVAVMEDGRIAAFGPPSEVLTDSVRIERARLRSTSLLRANLDRMAAGLDPLSAQGLAREGPA